MSSAVSGVAPVVDDVVIDLDGVHAGAVLVVTAGHVAALIGAVGQQGVHIAVGVALVQHLIDRVVARGVVVGAPVGQGGGRLVGDGDLVLDVVVVRVFDVAQVFLVLLVLQLIPESLLPGSLPLSSVQAVRARTMDSARRNASSFFIFIFSPLLFNFWC